MTTKEKVILHMDGDAFFVGVEVAKDHKLKGLPVVTGAERGIVTALSYEAKALGIVRGMPIFKIKREYPGVLILPGDYSAYVKYSEMMFDIVRRYADDVEEYSIDECFADLTGLDRPLKMSYRAIAEKIQKEMMDELALSVTIGVASTKVLAKVGSKWVKPHGLTVIAKNEIAKFLEGTPVEKVWGIGRKTTRALKGYGIHTAHDLYCKDEEWVAQHFSKPYVALWYELHGISVMPIDPQRKMEYASIQKMRTFHPATNNKDFLRAQISKHAEDACAKARHFGLVPKKVSVVMKTQNFRYVVGTRALVTPTSAPEVLIPLLLKEFDRQYLPSTPYRATGVTLSALTTDTHKQVDLFGGSTEADKFEHLHRAIDCLEDKLGKRFVHLGSTHAALTRTEGGTDSDDLDRHLLFL